jgi:hypothetical protein
MSGNFVTEQMYGLYEMYYNARRIDVWDFWPFNVVTRDYYNKLKRLGLKGKTRAVVMRDRAELITFESYKDE